MTGGVDSGFHLASAQAFEPAKGETTMPFAVTEHPLLDGPFLLRLTHVDVVDGAVKNIVPLLSAWHHTGEQKTKNGKLNTFWQRLWMVLD